MTVYDKAQSIANNGMKPSEVAKFFSIMEKTNSMHADIVNHIALFSQFGIDQNVVWDLYEQWQDELI